MTARKPTKKEMESLETELRKMLAELTGDISMLEEETLGEDAGVSESPEEGGSGGYSREVSLGLLENDEFLVREIMEALDRIKDGSYGRCDACESWIHKERLRAVPHTRNCIDCQRRMEEEVA